MSGKQEYVDASKQADVPQSLSKEYEARAESHAASDSNEAPPPTYRSLVDVVEEDVHGLQVGDPDESILVPMIHSTEKQSLKTVFLGKSPKVSRTVIARKMPRSHYLKFYAKDSDGNYIGTEKAAVDACLVFVPSKSTPEDLLQQVRKVAFGKQHYANDFGHVLGMPMVAASGATGGGF